MLQIKPIAGAVIGYSVAVVTSRWLPEFVSLLLPIAGCVAGSLAARKRPPNLPLVLPEEPTAPQLQGAGPDKSRPQPRNAAPQPRDAAGHPGQGQDAAAPEDNPLFQPLIEYLEVLEDMVISEGQKNNLDNEIVEKSLALFARLQRLFPLLTELRNDDINHRVKRLVLRDLNGFITPFLRLSGEAKQKNRRMLLNGLKDIQSDISSIIMTIEHKDLMELQARADLIHQRYSSDKL